MNDEPTTALAPLNGQEAPDTEQSVDEQAAALVPTPTGLPMEQDLLLLGRAMAQSGYFKDATKASQAIVKILFGREMGIGPAAAMSGIDIIDGNPVPNAGLIASSIKRSGRYDFTVTELTPNACTLTFFERGAVVGTSAFTIEDARAANLLGKFNWKAYPRNMLFCRALTNGARWYCADVFGGAIYERDELGGSEKPTWETPADD